MPASCPSFLLIEEVLEVEGAELGFEVPEFDCELVVAAAYSELVVLRK